MELFLSTDNSSINLNSGITIDAAEYGRYTVGGSAEVGFYKNKHTGKLMDVLLQNPQIKASIGYLVGEVQGSYNFQKEQGSVKARIGQDFGAGTWLGVSGSAWLVIPIIND